uniref:arogenate dehydratase n=1 Tax=Daucus carota subsp. sativus TaxID=79200 RepID=A0A166DSQ2_DAUCS
MAIYSRASLNSPSQLRSPTPISLTAQSPTSFHRTIRLQRKDPRFSIRVSIEDDNNCVDDNKHSSLAELASRDSRTHPRPLSTSDLSKSIRDRSRLRGVSGAYSESAAQKAYPDCEAVPCEQFDVAFQAVEQWVVDRAVLPIENSLGGSIHRNYDLLLRHRLHIVGEVKFAVRHCLLANHGVQVEDLKRVLSHPQALAQCELTLTKLGVVREAVDDTAGAAQYVSLHKLKDTGAVASLGAAKIYDMNVLAKDIQDDSDNITRFLILAREPIIPGTDRPFKTSIVFSLEEGPGVLFKALAVFAMRNINLTKIESRPRRWQPLRQAVDSNNGSLKYEFATFLRVLGSYPMDTD